MVLSSVAQAKLNLYLHITGKRDDGYHLLDSLVVFTEFGDRITVEASDDLSLTITGEFATGLPTQDNIVMKAAHALREKCGVSTGAKLAIEKLIPVGAGLGGGSSDAAAAMLLLNELWQTGLDKEQLAEIGLPLGADVPMCVHQAPCMVSGIGEVIAPTPELPAFHLLLVNPRQEVLTAEVYRNFQLSERHQPADEMAGYASLMEWLSAQRNDLQQPATTLCPIIQEVLVAIKETQDCTLTRMCGSGATCFGLYESQQNCIEASKRITSAHPDWWVQSTQSIA